MKQLKQLANFMRLCALLVLLNGFLISSVQAGCGGMGQRACCLGETTFACDAGLVAVAKGEYPEACVVGADTCLPSSPPLATHCGAEGERNCCLGERFGLTCDFGLEEQTDALPFDLFEAVSGDATCGNVLLNGSGTLRSRGTCVKHNALAPPSSGNIDTHPIPEPGTGWTAPTEPRGLMRGYLDMHLHLVGHLAHGGTVLSGEPAPVNASGNFVLNSTYNINTALSPDTDLALHKSLSHGLLNDTPGDGTQDGTRSWFGAPYFSGWPKWTSTTHQQAYYVWLERAWRGGLRAVTMLAVHNESLCKTSLKGTRETSWPLCADSMKYIVEQLKAAKDFERFIDDRSGGTGKGWFRIVTTPQQAREEVRAGKLAVVLGIEVDNLFNCKEQGCPADFGLPATRIASLTSLAQPTTIEQAVDVIYDIGVRHIFPVHNFDNGFGAAATWMDAIAVGQAVSEQRWWETRDCGDGRGDYGFWIDNALAPLMLLLGFGVGETPAVPFYINGNFTTTYASCNTRGLRSPVSQLIPGGQRLIMALMNKGMLIDIDHMSNRSLDDTIALTKTEPGSELEPYPLLAGHVQFFDLHQKEFRDNRGRHERMRTRAQLDTIRAGHGMIAAMLKDDVQDTDLKGEKYTSAYIPNHGGTITDDCRHSTKTLAQAFQYGVDVMGGPVAMGSDFNGAAGHVGPRFGSDACGGWGEPNGNERLYQEVAKNRVVYPFNLPGFGNFNNQITGFKTFDYNVDGLAHVGLLPDMVADLQKIGLNQYYMDKVFCSAEAYIRVWERAEALAGGLTPPDPERPWLCNIIDESPPISTVVLTPPALASGWHNGNVTATITATDADSSVERVYYSTTSSAQVSAGSATGDNTTVTISNEGTTTLAHHATDIAGNVEKTKVVTVKIDRTVPEITAVRAPLANAGGWNNSAVTVSFNCKDSLSGIQSCTTPQILSGESAGQSVTGDALDNANNHASTSVANINIDTTPPVVGVTGVTDGGVYIFGNVPVAGCNTSDALSGVAANAVVAVSGGTSNGVGSFSASCAGARDVAGNAANPVNASYNVHYAFNDFSASVNSPPLVNAKKAGQTVTLKFGLSGDHGLDVLQGGAPTSVEINCTSGTVDGVEVIATAPGANLFAYDPQTELYQYNWKTTKNWAGTCRRLLLKLDDGTVHHADFQLK